MVTWRASGIFAAMAPMMSGEAVEILLPADDEGRDADLPEEQGRVRALPHGAEGGDDAVGGVLEDHGPHVLHKLLVVL